MQSWESRKFSKKGPVHALDAALKDAAEGLGGFARADFLLRGLKETSEGWEADVLVIGERRRRESHHSALEQDVLVLEKKREEKERKKRREIEFAHKHALDEIYSADLEHSIELKQQVEHEDFEMMVLYVEFAYEELIRDYIEPRYDFDAIHYLPEGSLWEVEQKYNPDLAFYEAAHDEEEPSEEDDDRKPEAEPFSDLTLDLVDE
ncbi:MAG: hypothetical protein KDJ75_09570 [Alphaproteobacteria bacterium]|nr:hypothetical protein [Alphaproteobacteria bacterium]